MDNGLLRELGGVALLFAVTSGSWLFFQDPTSFGNGDGWDGMQYMQAARQLAAGQAPHGDSPFVYRLGVPTLVAFLFPHVLLQGFLVVNVAANLLTALLLAAWLRAHVGSPRVRLLLVFLFLMTWSSPARMVFYEAASLDACFLMAGLLNLIALAKWRQEPGWRTAGILAVTVALATLVREAGLLYSIAPAFGLMNGDSAGGWTASLRRRWVQLGLPVAAGLGVLLACRLVVEATGTYSFTETAVTWLFGRPLPTYLLSWLAAYGPVLLLAAFAWRQSLAWLGKNPELAYVLAATAVLGFIGGLQTERFVYWAMPVVAALIGRAFMALWPLARVWAWALLLLAQGLAGRWVWTLPDFPLDAGRAPPWRVPVFAPQGHLVRLRDLLPSSAPRLTQAIELAWYCWMVAVLWLAVHARKAPVARTDAIESISDSVREP